MFIDEFSKTDEIVVKRESHRTVVKAPDSHRSYTELIKYSSLDNRVGRQVALEVIGDYAQGFEGLVELAKVGEGYWNDNQRSELRYASDESEEGSEVVPDGYVAVSAPYAFPGIDTLAIKEEVYRELLRQVLLLNGEVSLAKEMT